MNAIDTSSPAKHFDALFARDADPWQTRTRWYERRKRALTLAALPRERYARAYEPGCGAGETTLALAQRCDELLASDASEAAVGQARARLSGTSNVSVVQAHMPHNWPPGSFDLIVVSELGYYLDAGKLTQLAQHCRDALSDGGTLLACHWRHPADDLRLNAPDVHAILHERTGLRRLSHYEDEDFLLDAWSTDGRSVAAMEGLA